MEEAITLEELQSQISETEAALVAAAHWREVSDLHSANYLMIEKDLFRLKVALEHAFPGHGAG